MAPPFRRDRPMKITRIRVYSVNYTPKGGDFELSGGRRFHGFQSAIVRIDTDEGVTGWGEHGSAPTYMVALHKGALAALELIAPSLIGLDPRGLAIIHDRMDMALQGHSYAKTAIDIACWDIAARAANVPLAVMLGGIYRTEFPIIDVVHLSEPEHMREEADRLFEEGFKTVQVKVGSKWQDDVMRIRTTWETAHRFDNVIVDANAHWLQHEAQQVVRAVSDLGVMIEQPCRLMNDNLAVRRRSSLPMVLDESLDSLTALFAAQAADGFDCAMLKLSRFGGITPMRMARDLCIAWGKAVTMEDMAGSDIIAAVSAHLAASTPVQNLVVGSFVTSFVNEHIGTGIRQGQGKGHLPDGPGLGIEIDEAALDTPLLDIRAA